MRERRSAISATVGDADEGLAEAAGTTDPWAVAGAAVGVGAPVGGGTVVCGGAPVGGGALVEPDAHPATKRQARRAPIAPRDRFIAEHSSPLRLWMRGTSPGGSVDRSVRRLGGSVAVARRAVAWRLGGSAARLPSARGSFLRLIVLRQSHFADRSNHAERPAQPRTSMTRGDQGTGRAHRARTCPHEVAFGIRLALARAAGDLRRVRRRKGSRFNRGPATRPSLTIVSLAWNHLEVGSGERASRAGSAPAKEGLGPDRLGRERESGRIGWGESGSRAGSVGARETARAADRPRRRAAVAECSGRVVGSRA
jgi:hypothetical protein